VTRTASSTVLSLLALALVAPTSLAFAQDNNAEPHASALTSVNIFYSGRMMGYLREDKVGDEFELSAPADFFLKGYRAKCASKRCILLGMGDNFSPEYQARLDDDGHFKKRNDANTTVQNDNVARFLHKAQFNALVPSKEDFYLGAYRLWKIADSMNQNPPDQSTGGPFLADNLVLRPQDEKNRESWIDASDHKPGKHVKKFTEHAAWVTSSFSGRAMPWVAKLTFTFDPPLTADQATNLKGRICEDKDNPDDIDPNRTDPARKCIQWTTDPKINPEHVGEIKEVSFVRTRDTQLDRGRDYGFCLANPRQPSTEPQYCLPIHVEVPMFDSPYVLACDAERHEVAIFAVVDPQIRSYMPKQNAGWDLVDPKAAQGDALLKNSIPDPHQDKDWIPHRVEIAALPPQDALQQALDAFIVDYVLSHPGFRGTTVLMAQMDMDQADELGRHLKAPDELKLNQRQSGDQKDTPEFAFDLVLAKAEFSHQTREQTISVTAEKYETRYRFLAVPPPAWTDNDTFQLPLGSVTITRRETPPTPHKPQATAEYAVHTGYCPDPDDPTKTEMPSDCKLAPAKLSLAELQRRLNHGVAATSQTYKSCYVVTGSSKSGDCSTNLAACLMKFATCAMLQDNKTFDIEGSDVAFLQPRDIWVPKGNPPEEQLDKASTVQGVLDRIFWKDDLLSHANLSGSQLKSLIKESTTIENGEKNPLWILRDTTGLGLTDVGLLKGTAPQPGSKDTSYYVRLQELSDSSVFRVAASSFISNGDTGYTEFSKPAAGKVEFFRDDATKSFPGKVGVRISVLVCEALKEGIEPNYAPLYHCGETERESDQPSLVVREKSYALSSSQTEQIVGLVVPDDREQDNAGEYIEAQAKELQIGRDPFVKDPSTGQPKNGNEKLLQNYPYLDVDLEKFAVGGSLNTALASKAQTANFGGVLQSDIPQPSKGEFSWYTNLRLLDRRGRWDFGGAIDEEFDKSEQANLIRPSTPTWSFDTMALGPVIQFVESDPRVEPRRLLTFHLLDGTTQISNTSLTLTGAANSASFELGLRRNYGYQSKGGYRYESGTSYFEIGGLHVNVRDVLSEIAGLPNGAVCSINGNVSLVACVGKIMFPPNSPAPTLHYSNLHQGGLYWDGKLDFDVLKGKWTYEVTSKGNYYFIGQNGSALTRFDIRVGNSLKFPLFGNFSLTPIAEWRFFENQGPNDFIKRLNTSVQLTYTFHKDSRVRLLDAMAYKASTTAAP
jgi:hypothetical protein